jgi:SAM-dependent methyltransferase
MTNSDPWFSPADRQERRRALNTILERVAAEYGPPAEETILGENGGKHVFELETLLDLAPRGGRVLDVGGGLGVDLLCLHEAVGDELELHLVDRFVEYTAENRMGDQGVGLNLLRSAGIHVMNRDFWPDPKLEVYPENHFDVVCSFDVIEHLPGHPLPLFREIRRILKPGGAFLLGSPNAISVHRRLTLLSGRHPYIDFDEWCSERYFQHYREYTAAEHRALLERAGFECERPQLVSEPLGTLARVARSDPATRLSVRSGLLQVLAAAERVAPPLRGSVYCVGRKHRT